MDSRLLAALNWVMGRIRARRELYPAISIVFASVLYMFATDRLWNPALELLEPELRLGFPGSYREISIHFDQPVVVDRVDQVLAAIKDSSDGSETTAYGAEATRLDIKRPQKWPPAAPAEVGIRLRTAFPPLISRIEVDGVQLRGEELHRLVRSKFKNVRMRRIADDLSRLVLRFNSVVSNFLMTAMITTSILIAAGCGSVIWSAYGVSDERLTAELRRLCDTVGGWPEVRSEMARRYSTVRTRALFLEVLGPALGFLLTVSSLIAALAPPFQAIQNVGRFFASIQIAMVSTFVGLVMRVICIALLRWNDASLARADGQLDLLEGGVNEAV